MTVTESSQLSKLDSAKYYSFVSGHLHRNHNRLWDEVLLSEELAPRTSEVLAQAGENMTSASAKIRTRETEIAELLASGQLSHEDYLAELAEVDKKRRGLSSFRRMHAFRSRQARQALKKIRAASHEERQKASEAFHRSVLARVAFAIDEHRESMHDEDYKPTEYDRALWAVLDSEKVPYRSGMETLGELIANGAWDFSSDGKENDQ